MEDKLIDLLENTLKRSTDTNKKMLDTLDRIHKRDIIKDGLMLGLFIIFITVLYLF